MGFLDYLSGASEIGTAKGFDINRDDFQIKDADKLFNQTQDQYGAAQNRQEAISGKKSNLLNALEQSAMGTGPSLADEQLRQTQDRNLAQQLAVVQAQRNPNGALAQRQVLRGQAESNATTAQAGVQARLQEQQQNRQLYAQTLGQEQQAVDQLTQQYLSMGFDIRQAQEKALEAYNQLQTQQATQLASVNAENQRAKGAMNGKLIGGLISGAATLGASSMAGGGAAPSFASAATAAPAYSGANTLGGGAMYSSLGNSSFAAPSQGSFLGATGYLRK